MSEKNQENEIKVDLIQGIKTEYNQEIIDFLKENGYKFHTFECKDLTPYQTKKDIEQGLPLIEIKQEYYDTLKMISELMDLPIKIMVNSALYSFFENIKEQPECFLENYFGDLNLLDIFNLIYSNMKGE